MTEIQQLEQLMNEMLPGLQLFARDINLTPEEASKFHVGQIVRNAAFTDATSRIGGMVTTHRFSILSNHLFDLTKAEHGTNWGLHVANRDSHFKVLDIYEHEGKTQILLLHLPGDYRWKWLEDLTIHLPGNLVDDCRSRFLNKAFGEPIPEVTSEDWLERCGFPIGVDMKGKLFSNEIPITQQMRPVKEASFRSFYHELVYIRCAALIEDVMPEVAKAGDTGLVLYGYIDEEAGVSFQPLWIAKEGESTLDMRLIPEETMYLIRLANLDDCEFCSMKWIEVDPYIVDRARRVIAEVYDTKSKEKEETRSFQGLDRFRRREHPDDFGVAFYYEDKTKDPERLWVRISRVEGNQCFGTLLMDSKHPDGLKEGMEIMFKVLQNENGELEVVSVQV